MSKPDLKAIRERCEAATEGPWEECKEDGVDIIGSQDIIILEICLGAKLNCHIFDENITFIAHARQDIPDLLDDNTAKAEEIERLREVLKDMHFAYMNKDGENPHQFEIEVLEQYNALYPKEPTHEQTKPESNPRTM